MQLALKLDDEIYGDVADVYANFGGIRMTSRIRWTNPSVLRFAGDSDPMQAMEERVRAAVLSAKDQGWVGPPFDPVELARMLGMKVEPRGDIPDARTVASGQDLLIEFNPSRPRARVKFSVAHEIAHSFFPDCADAIRNRGGNPESGKDDWQLEVLCNVGAAELLMPGGSFPDISGSKLQISKLLELRREFDVSTEALLIRAAKLSTEPCAAFCASHHDDHYRLDYVIKSRGWTTKVAPGLKLPETSVVSDANAIGFTATGDESWIANERVHVECVALSPYAGGLVPRVVGFITPIEATAVEKSRFDEVAGDALAPRGKGRRIVSQVIPDNNTAWGGRGFAAQVRKRFPDAWQDFKRQAVLDESKLSLGRTYRSELSDDIVLFSMVAQRGYGPAMYPRIRYTALASGLTELADLAVAAGATVHMPRIGTGQAGGDWNVIRELILDLIVQRGVNVTVYSPPA